MADSSVHQLHIMGLGLTLLHELQPGITVAGRQGTDLILAHFLVSRKHARFDLGPNYCRVMDLNSANGTTLNGEPLAPDTPVSIQPGDVVEIGPFKLEYARVSPDSNQGDSGEGAVIDEAGTVSMPSVSAVNRGQGQPSLGPSPDRGAGRRPPGLNGSAGSAEHSNGHYLIPPGLSLDHSKYVEYLPGIYHTDFVTRFLAMLEAIWTPIEWYVDNFDLYLSPRTAPNGFLPWLANWFDIAFDDSWTEERRRQLLQEAPRLYARRGTTWALSRILEIYLGEAPEINDTDASLEQFAFAVRIPRKESEVDSRLIRGIIDANKPAYTTYFLAFESSE